MADAVGLERISAVVGYQIDTGNFSESSPNLPQRVALFGEANTANQATLDLTPFQITSAAQAASRYGAGSPIHIAARILLPNTGGGLGGIPLIVYPQLQAVGASSKRYTITPVGTATDNGTHTIVIAGRTSVDGETYDINIEAGDTASDINQKISDTVNAVYGCPMTALDYDYETVLESKWKGASANGLNVSVDTNGKDLGITYTVNSISTAAGTPDIQDALDLFGNEWNTWVVNTYGTVTSVMATLESFNGIPSPTNPTGRYNPIVMKPLVALTGSVDEDPSIITNTRLDQCTISISPAPLSKGLAMEAAANDCVNRALVAQNSPQIDVLNLSYADMPTPADIGLMSSYNERDRMVKRGCSTVDLVNGRYQMKDPVTTYHPIGEVPPQFRYTHDLIIDWNVRYTYLLLEQINVVAKMIANNQDIVTAQNVVKPKTWKGVLFGMFDDLVARGLIVDAAFSKASLSVTLSASNQNRIDTRFNAKRSGVARISSTNAVMGFNFGTLTA